MITVGEHAMTMAPERDFAELRSQCRHQMREACTLTYDGISLSCSVMNVGLGGALVVGPNLPPICGKVVFAMDHMGSIHGTAVRCGADGTAIRFDPGEAKAVGINDMVTFVLNQGLLDGPAD